jgi:hypothetical protein
MAQGRDTTSAARTASKVATRRKALVCEVPFGERSPAETSWATAQRPSAVSRKRRRTNPFMRIPL